MQTAVGNIASPRSAGSPECAASVRCGKEIGSRVLSRDKIRHGIRDPAIVFRSQEALGAKQVVVQEPGIGKRAAHVDEEPEHLLVINAPQHGSEI